MFEPLFVVIAVQVAPVQFMAIARLHWFCADAGMATSRARATDGSKRGMKEAS
jgi:hypothetical protein